MNNISEDQEKFIWLAHAEKMHFSEIEKRLNVSRATLSEWEIKLRPLWEEVSTIKSIFIKKQITLEFKIFYDWYKSKEQNKKCYYCHITENEINSLYDKKVIETKRTRGRILEFDRKDPNLSYDKLENIVYSCYWCNNAKTDTFTHEEFMEIGKVISKIWKQRQTKL